VGETGRDEGVGGRYRRITTLGSGGQGVVEKATDTTTDRVVALKIQAIGPDTDRDAILDEARVLLGVPPHPNIALARRDFFDGDSHVLVMDFIDGPSLATRLAENRSGLAPDQVVQWLGDVAAALDHLHAQRPPIVHGDVKPANVVIDDDRAVLVDFGLARLRTAAPAQATRAYAAPEALAGIRTPATDMYSFAATACTLLTGTPPVPGAGADLAAEARNVLARGLVIDPAARPHSARGFVDDLAAALAVAPPDRGLATGARRAARPGRWFVAAAVGLVLVVMTTLLVRNEDAPEAVNVVGPTTTVAPATTAQATTTAAVTTTNPQAAAIAPGRDAAVAGRIATVASDGTIEVRRILEGGIVEAGRPTAAPAPAWTTAVQVRRRDVLLYRSNDKSQSAFIDEDGAAAIEHAYVVGANYALGTGIDDGWVYFYRRDGFVGWARLDDDNNFVGGSNAQSSENANFDALAYAGARRVLQYDRETGAAWLSRITTDNALQSLARPNLPSGFTVLAPTGREFVVGVDATGSASVLSVSDAGVAAGARTPIGAGNYSTAAAFAGGTVVLDRTTGQGRVVWVSGDGRVTRTDSFTAPRDALLVAVD
jgi:tRNA A-37 threonylcarbamoyl transferase component Bud32